MKVEFITGLMGAGKTAKLISEFEKDSSQIVVRVIPTKFSENEDIRVSSRNGKSLDKVIPIYTGDVLRNQCEALEEAFESKPINSPILIDEVQFLDPFMIRELFYLSELYGREVKLFGLHSNFRGELFDSIETLKSFIPRSKWTYIDMKCQEENCDLIAAYNARFLDNGKIDVDGPVILQQKSSYRSICRPHFRKFM